MLTVDFKRIEIKPGFRILDIGCGSGRHTGEVCRFQDVVAVGADLRLADLQEAEGRLQFHDEIGETKGCWGLTASNILNLPFKDATFDVVICSEVMEHIPDHEDAAAELLRVLKPGCLLVVSVPRGMPERICWVLSKEYNAANDGHVRIYTREELVSLIESAGARLNSSQYAHGIHSPYWWLKCAVGPAKTDSMLVNLYHKLLVYDIMEKPKITRIIDKALTPLIGKSSVYYFFKEPAAS